MSTKTFTPFCLCLVDYGKPGTAWEEANDGATFESAVKRMIEGNLDGCQRALMIYPDRAPEDVTQALADAVIEEERLTDDTLDFCENFGSASTQAIATREIRHRRDHDRHAA
jgi:hypothetical protein